MRHVKHECDVSHMNASCHLCEGTDDFYGVATISRLLKIIGLFCKRALQKRRYSAKETHNFKELTNRSHPISHMNAKMFSITYDECKDVFYARKECKDDDECKDVSYHI